LTRQPSSISVEELYKSVNLDDYVETVKWKLEHRSPYEEFEMEQEIYILESLVFARLANTYGRSFLGSDQCEFWLKHKIVQEKPVTKADFTQFRILGRGGFGLVYGGSSLANISCHPSLRLVLVPQGVKGMQPVTFMQ